MLNTKTELSEEAISQEVLSRESYLVEQVEDESLNETGSQSDSVDTIWERNYEFYRSVRDLQDVSQGALGAAK